VDIFGFKIVVPHTARSVTNYHVIIQFVAYECISEALQTSTLYHLAVMCNVIFCTPTYVGTQRIKIQTNTNKI